MLGIYMGLSPTLVTGPKGSSIHFNTDIGHILLAVMYFVAFIGVTEAAFVIAKWKFFTREERNDIQKWTMLASMGIAGLSILGTGIAGGMVVASNIAFLSEFVEIPPAAQKWVVIAIPVLIVLYTFLFSAYALSSDTAASERLMNEKERERALDNRTRMHAIRQIAAEKLQVAEIEAFERLVLQGLLSSAEALAAIEAGRSLKQEEIFLGRDLTNDHKIGDQPMMMPVPQLDQQTSFSDNGRGKRNP
jgi:TRAP-type C4-dicarboxylate transport system permease small subunit